MLVLRNANIIDSVTPGVQPGSVVIEGRQILDVVPAGGAVPDGDTIDLEGGFLLPGLWDCHSHPGYGGSDPVERVYETVAERAVRFGRHVLEALQGGVTGLRCVGEPGFIDVAWKRAIDRGDFVGPRIFACGYFLTTTAGHFLRSGAALEVDGAEGWRVAIRDHIKHGVDFIKVNMTGGIMGPAWDAMDRTFLTPDEVTAAFEIAHQRGIKVVAHAGGTDGIKQAVRAGAHTIEHGYILDDRAIELMKQHGTIYVPTLSLSHLVPGNAQDEYEERFLGSRAPLPPDLTARAYAAMTAHEAGFRKALAAGVPIACGSDVHPPREAPLLEIAQLVRHGMSEWQAIVAATRTSAEACCAEDRLGTVEPGKLADLIVVRDNPLDRIHNLRSLQLVLVNGAVVVDRRGVAVTA
jgi:imidazolonepropionase-like amidohydrolase